MFGKNRKKIIMIIAALLALLMIVPTIVSILTTPAAAASSAELQEMIDKLKTQASGIESAKKEMGARLDANKSETASVVDEKYALDQQIEIINLEVENTNALIQSYNLLIAAKQEELDQAIRDEEEQYERFQARIRAMEENGDVSYFSVLFNANSFSDLLDRIDLIEEIAGHDKKVIEELENARLKVVEAQEGLELEKQALSESRELLAIQESELAVKRVEADALLTNLAAQADEFEAAFREYEAEQMALQGDILKLVSQYETVKAEEEAARKAAEEARRKAEAARSSGKVSASSASARYYSYYSDSPVAESGFLYPLPAGTASVTCAFGYRIHPTIGTYSMHTGVDLGAAGGTNIYSSKSGTVITSTMGSAYGNYVVVSHGSGQATLYAHMSSRAVSEGDYVTQGQTIGYVGTTGWSTGNHLHFEIIIDGEYQNPMDYVSVQ